MSDLENPAPPNFADAIVGVAYPSVYAEDMDAVAAFWTAIVGPPGYQEDDFFGWKLGDTWLTVFPASHAAEKGIGTRNGEFALRVDTPADVDRVYARMVELGSKEHARPEDTWMYVPMRFSCLETPHGLRVDIICPLPADTGSAESGDADMAEGDS